MITVKEIQKENAQKSALDDLGIDRAFLQFEGQRQADSLKELEQQDIWLQPKMFSYAQLRETIYAFMSRSKLTEEVRANDSAIDGVGKDLADASARLDEKDAALQSEIEEIKQQREQDETRLEEYKDLNEKRAEDTKQKIQTLVKATGVLKTDIEDVRGFADTIYNQGQS